MNSRPKLLLLVAFGIVTCAILLSRYWPQNAADSSDPEELVTQIQNASLASPNKVLANSARYVSHSDSRVAVAAISALGTNSHPEALTLLQKSLADPRVEVRQASLCALGNSPLNVDPEVFLAALNAPEQSEQMRSAAIHAVASRRMIQAVPALVQCLNSPIKETRADAYGAIQRITGKSYNFDPNSTAEERQSVIASIAKDLQHVKSKTTGGSTHAER